MGLCHYFQQILKKITIKSCSKIDGWKEFPICVFLVETPNFIWTSPVITSAENVIYFVPYKRRASRIFTVFMPKLISVFTGRFLNIVKPGLSACEKKRVCLLDFYDDHSCETSTLQNFRDGINGNHAFSLVSRPNRLWKH